MDTKKIDVVKFLDKDEVACCDDDVVAWFDEVVLSCLDNNNKYDFDVDFLRAQPFGYLLGGAW